MDNIKICVKVAEIEGHAVTSDGITHNLVPCYSFTNQIDGIIPITPHGNYLVKFDPIHNDALCFNLMLKYEIKISKNRDDLYVAMYSHSRGEEHVNPNIAICLSIISKIKGIK